MKINKIIFNCFLAVVLTGLVFTACKKTHESTLVNTTDDTDTQSIIALDELEVNTEFDQAVNDAITASSISSTTSGDTAASSTTGNILLTTISGAVIDTNQINMGIVKITYYGKNAENTKGRTGEVKIKHAVSNGKIIPWKTQGANATITFTTYEVIFLDTVKKSIWLDGNCSVTNISGGLLKNIANPLLVPGDSLVDKVRAELFFTRNDNITVIKKWTWHFNQLRVFNLNGTTVTATIKGDTAINNNNNVVTWGTTRFDQNFYTSITTPILQNISGSTFLYDPLKGRKVILGITEPITITYGVDQQGSPATTGNPYGYIITWTNSGGQAKQAVVSY